MFLVLLFFESLAARTLSFYHKVCALLSLLAPVWKGVGIHGCVVASLVVSTCSTVDTLSTAKTQRVRRDCVWAGASDDFLAKKQKQRVAFDDSARFCFPIK